MVSRAVLALFIATIVGARSFIQQQRGSEFVFQMSSSAAGYVQLFFDLGSGFNEGDSVQSPIGSGLQTYRLQLPAGTLRALRFDPGTRPGLYDIRDASVVDASGSRLRLSLTRFFPLHQLSVLEGNDRRLLVQCPDGAFDPQMVYTPATPIALGSPRSSTALLVLAAALFAGAFAIVVAFEQLAGSTGLDAALARLSAYASRRAGCAIPFAAALATVAATYPVTMLGRSFVTPNNGGTEMLYNQPPFVPGSTDLSIEDSRLSDTGAMMWAFVPYARVQREALSRGEIPFWDRYNSSGIPLWGQGQSLLLDPLHWLAFIRRDPALGLDLKFIAHRFVFAWGIGVAGLIAAGSATAAIAAAVIAPFAGLFTYRINHPAVFSVTYAPWILVAWFVLARATTLRQAARAGVLLTAASTLELVASPPKEAATLLLICHVTGVLALLLAPRQLSTRLAWLGVAAVAVVGMVLFTAPHWLVFLETLRASVTSYDAPGVSFAGAPQAAAFALGNLVPGPLWTGLNVVGVTFACAALVLPGRIRTKTVAIACVLAAAGTIAVAFGVIPESAILRIPLMSNIHQIGQTFMLGLIVLVLIVAAVGIEALAHATGREALIATAAVVAAGAWLLSTLQAQTALETFDWTEIALILGLAIMLPWLVFRAGVAQSMVPALAAGVTVCVLLLPSGMQLETGFSAVDHLLPQPRFRVSLDRVSPAVQTVQHAEIEPTRTIGTSRVLFAGTQALYGFEGIEGPDALRNEHFERLMDAAGVAREWNWHRLISFDEVPRLNPLLDLLNVRFLLVGSRELPVGTEILNVKGQDQLAVVARTTAWPRAFYVDHASEYKDLPAFLALVALRRGPFAAIDRADKDGQAAGALLKESSQAAVAATNYRLTSNTTSFSVESTGPGVAVLTEAFLPRDFIATLNGSPTPYFRVNAAFKGVLIPGPGHWDVRFEYRPAHWRLSLLFAGLGFVVVVFLVRLGYERSSGTMRRMV